MTVTESGHLCRSVLRGHIWRFPSRTRGDHLKSPRGFGQDSQTRRKPTHLSAPLVALYTSSPVSVLLTFGARHLWGGSQAGGCPHIADISRHPWPPRGRQPSDIATLSWGGRWGTQQNWPRENQCLVDKSSKALSREMTWSGTPPSLGWFHGRREQESSSQEVFAVQTREKPRRSETRFSLSPQAAP